MTLLRINILLPLLLLSSTSLWSNPDDLQLVALNKAVHGHAAEELYRSTFDGSASDALYDQKSSNCALLLNNTFIGFAIFRDFLTANNRIKRHVYNLAIVESMRSKGYGTNLVQMLIDGVQARNNIDLIEINATPESKKFYTKKLAFREKAPESLTMIKYLNRDSDITTEKRKIS